MLDEDMEREVGNELVTSLLSRYSHLYGIEEKKKFPDPAKLAELTEFMRELARERRRMRDASFPEFMQRQKAIIARIGEMSDRCNAEGKVEMLAA